MSCRCDLPLCKDRESCPSANKPVQYYDNGTAKTLNIDDARRQLAESGRLQLSERNESYSAECSFQSKNMSAFQLCNKVNVVARKEIHRRAIVHQQLKRDYGVSGEISSRRFIRSIFIVLSGARATRCGDACEIVPKKPRVASKEVSIGMAKAKIAVEENAWRSRTKEIFRFYSAAYGEMEICIESKSSYNYNWG